MKNTENIDYLECLSLWKTWWIRFLSPQYSTILNLWMIFPPETNFLNLWRIVDNFQKD